MEQTQYTDVAETPFRLSDADGCPEMRCHGINKSREHALSLCSVRFRGTPRDTTLQATCLRHERNLGGTTPPRNRPQWQTHRATTCGLKADIRFQS